MPQAVKTVNMIGMIALDNLSPYPARADAVIMVAWAALLISPV